MNTRPIYKPQLIKTIKVSITSYSSFIQSLSLYQDVEIPHYNQISQMLSHFSQLSGHMLSKSEEYLRQVQELNYMKSEFEQKLLESNSVINSLENEIKTHEQRISHLEADSTQFENLAREKDQELREANTAAENYQRLNDEL